MLYTVCGIHSVTSISNRNQNEPRYYKNNFTQFSDLFNIINTSGSYQVGIYEVVVQYDNAVPAEVVRPVRP